MPHIDIEQMLGTLLPLSFKTLGKPTETVAWPDHVHRAVYLQFDLRLRENYSETVKDPYGDAVIYHLLSFAPHNTMGFSTPFAEPTSPNYKNFPWEKFKYLSGHDSSWIHQATRAMWDLQIKMTDNIIERSGGRATCLNDLHQFNDIRYCQEVEVRIARGPSDKYRDELSVVRGSLIRDLQY